MRRADFLRAKDSLRNLVAKSTKLSPHLLVADAQMVFDVLEEDDAGFDGCDGFCDVRPEMARILRAELPAGARERLAGVTGSEDIHAAAPRPAVEGFKIRPNRSRIERSVFHTRDQLFNGSDFVFHEAARASAFNCQAEAEIDPGDAGAEREDENVGMCIHIHAACSSRMILRRIAAHSEHSSRPHLSKRPVVSL